MSKLFCLNTITNFKKLIYDPFAVPFLKENPEVELYNILDDTLLLETQRAGTATPSLIRRIWRYVEAAREFGADCVLCTCTSINGATRYLKRISPIPLLGIEEPVVEEAVRRGGRIGILSTLPTSAPALIRSIEERAAEERQPVSIVTRVAEGAFELLCAGDRARHDSLILEQLRAFTQEVDTVVLAQISMSLLEHGPCAVPVLKIGRSGYELAKKRMLEGAARL